MFTLGEAHVLFLIMVFVTVILSIISLVIYELVCITRRMFDRIKTKINYDETI